MASAVGHRPRGWSCAGVPGWSLRSLRGSARLPHELRLKCWWRVMALWRGGMETRTRVRVSCPPAAAPREARHEALDAPPGHDGRRGGRAPSAATAGPRRDAAPPRVAALVPMTPGG